MHSENNKKTDWAIATLEDISEIKSVMEYSRGLIIKSQQIADSYETIDSMRNGTRYITAKLDLNGQDEIAKRIIIDNYKEKNKYYLYLNENFGIDFVDSRTANDLTILKATNKVLNTKDERLFLECYNEVLIYYKNVFFTKAFINQQFNLEYFILNLIAMTVQRYLTKKMENYFDIDTYTKKQLKNSFISYGFDYFDILPINYQRRLLKLLNELIISKGTNHDIRKILDIFGNKNIDIYKYVICKMYPFNSDGSYDYKNPYLVFYKTLADGIIDYDKDIMLSFESVTKDDILWKVDEKEVLYETPFNEELGIYDESRKIQRRFNTITSKYMSIDFSVDILRDTLRMSYFFNLLYKFEKDYKDKQSEEDFSFYNKNIANTRISLFTAVVGFISLMLKKIGVEDKINFFPNKLNDIYGYNNFENNNDIIDILKEINILLIQNKDIINKNNAKYDEMYKFFRNFNLYNFDMPKVQRNMDIVYELARNNSEIEYQLKNGFDDYTENIALISYLKDLNSNNSYYKNIKDDNGNIIDKKLVVPKEEHDLIDKLEFLRKSIINGSLEIKYLNLYPELSKCLSEYIVINAYSNPETRTDFYSILNHKFFITELEDFINNIDKNEFIKSYYDIGDYLELFEALYQYTLSHRVEITKKYKLDTDDKINVFLYSDKSDITYYKNIYAFMNIFYIPFKNEKENVIEKYSVSQFMDVFNSNEKIRNQLFEFIKEIDDYDLYYQMNKLYETKFLTKQDTSLYKDYTHFSDYVKDNNYEFYLWLNEREEEILNKTLTGEDKKAYYREKLFELAESIDAYLGTSLFINNPTSGILDFMVVTLNLIATVFKAFTVDLQQSDSVIRIDNSDYGYDYIKLFDKIDNFEISQEIKSKINLEDVFVERFYETYIDINKNKKDDKGLLIDSDEIISDNFNITINENEENNSGVDSVILNPYYNDIKSENLDKLK